jgi:kynurenine 3-monooxygenase
MSSKTADENFLLQKKIEKSFSDKHPENGFLYTVELLSDRPYAEALAIGDYQICHGRSFENEWNITGWFGC